jgi:hypothetical protein
VEFEFWTCSGHRHRNHHFTSATPKLHRYTKTPSITCHCSHQEEARTPVLLREEKKKLRVKRRKKKREKGEIREKRGKGKKKKDIGKMNYLFSGNYD